MMGYMKGIQTYWFNRGYAEGNNKLPMSSTNANYINGYDEATQDLAQFGNVGKIPMYNYDDFYLGIYQGGAGCTPRITNIPNVHQAIRHLKIDCQICPVD